MYKTIIFILIIFIASCTNKKNTTLKKSNIIETTNNAEQESIDILVTDWGKEIFKFPIRFAQEINYTGIEEARFPKGWREIENPEFWSYVFAWHIDLAKEMTISQIETDLNIYFNGLMNVNIKKYPKTIAKFKKISKNNFEGTIKTIDNFTTKKIMTLNVTVEQFFCKDAKKSVVIFRFSPKGYNHTIWNKLNDIKLNDAICKNK
jgi:hypothetical protein